MDEAAAYLKLLLVAIIVLQRFAVPLGGGQVPLLLPAGLLIIAVAVWRGVFVVEPVRASLVALMWVTALVCTMAQLVVGELPSVLSLALLLLLYIPALFVARVEQRVVASVFRFYVQIMTVAAVVAVGQFGLQYAGIPNTDYIATSLPESFILRGFIPNAPVTYGVPLRRSNGLIFLEPSFLSLFLGLAVLVALWMGMSWAWSTVLLAGMVPTLAGNGIVVLLPGILILLFTARRQNTINLVPGIVLALVAAAATPLGPLYLGRTGEAGSSQSSASFRFIQPYTTLLPASFGDPFHAIFGHGSGQAEQYYAREGLFALTQPLIPKVLYEYGVIGAVGLAAALITLLMMGARGRIWLAGLVVVFVFVNASLLLTVGVFATVYFLQLLPAAPLGAPPAAPPGAPGTEESGPPRVLATPASREGEVAT